LKRARRSQKGRAIMADEHMKALARIVFDQRFRDTHNDLAAFKISSGYECKCLSCRTAARLATQRLQDLKGEPEYKKGEKTHRRCETAVSDARWHGGGSSISVQKDSQIGCGGKRW